MDATRKKKTCFRCGRELDKCYNDGGQITWSGFVNANDGAYYNQVTLCEHCHEELLKNISYFMTTKVDNGEKNA